MKPDLDHLREWIGREETRSELLTDALVERFNATFDRQGSLEDGAAAPLFIHLCLGQPAAPTAELGPDGHPARGGFLPPVPLPRRMWAGGEVAFHDDIRIGEVVTRRSIIADVTLKEGRTGTLCFVTVNHHVTSGGRDVLSERQDIVYRDVDTPGGAPRPAPEPAPPGDNRRDIPVTPAFLFRYSALTFNGHRIHYDVPYVTGEERYPGLIVHGPIQATLLAQYAADLHGRVPARFSFRSLSPIFGTHDLSINASMDGDEMKLWTAATDGPVAMTARAVW